MMKDNRLEKVRRISQVVFCIRSSDVDSFRRLAGHFSLSIQERNAFVFEMMGPSETLFDFGMIWGIVEPELEAGSTDSVASLLQGTTDICKAATNLFLCHDLVSLSPSYTVGARVSGQQQVPERPSRDILRPGRS